MAVKTQCDVFQKEIAGDEGDGSQGLTQKWYFSRKEIESHSPSRSDGIDYKHEEHLRKLYCSFLQELGIELKVPQVTIATAMMFCHRFYMRQSHAKNDWQTIATACMFLASKAEETPRWLNELVVVAYKLIYKWDPSAPRRIREIYDKQKELILIAERLLLHVLAFDLNIEHPYKSLVRALKRLDITHKELIKVAWNFVNDWLRTSLCLQHKPHYIAAASLFIATKIMKVKLPKGKEKTWWMEFDVSPNQLEVVIQQMKSSWDQSQRPSQSQSQSQTVPPKAEKVIKSPIRRPTTTASNCVKKEIFEKVNDASREPTHSSSKCVKKEAFEKVNDASREPTISLSNCVKKEVLEKAKDPSTETTNSQTSDTGSGVSAVENADIGEPVTVKSELISSCKAVKLVGGNGVVVDVNKIREKIKKRSLVGSMKRNCAEEGVDDGEDWIERAIENGIVLQSADPAVKRQKI